MVDMEELRKGIQVAVSVHDAAAPGNVDAMASNFIPRSTLTSWPSTSISAYVTSLIALALTKWAPANEGASLARA